jgi:hypothetical protein
MAAVFVLLAGGANALANTVWCVPSASLNPSCTSGTTFSHIQSAVSVASAGDVVVVGPGYYNESVDIETYNLTLLGAQAGKDARQGRNGRWQESIVDATNQTAAPPTGGNGAAFYVHAFNVVIDGFTIQGGTKGTAAAGIWTDEINIQILNNIIRNNAVGTYIDGGMALIEYNLFQTNNTPKAGSADAAIENLSGFGIAGETLAGTAITENEFTGNLAAAMYFYTGSGGAVTENTSTNDGSFVVFNNCENTVFSHNQGQNFGAKGFLHIIGSSHADAAIDVLYSNSSLQINDNDLEKGKSPGYNGIAFSTIITPDSPPAYVCLLCQVSNNTIKGFEGSGIVAETPPTGTGTLNSSLISRNDLEDNRNDGILIGWVSDTENYLNSLVDNQAEGNHPFDCADDTIGSGLTLLGTLGTADTWINNTGSSNLPGLCTPGRGNHH